MPEPEAQGRRRGQNGALGMRPECDSIYRAGLRHGLGHEISVAPQFGRNDDVTPLNVALTSLSEGSSILNDVGSLLSSPRFVNRLLWASALVLFAGILTFVVVFFGQNKSPTTAAEAAGEAPATSTPAPGSRKTVPLDPKARTTAGRWILSAVTREDLSLIHI